MTDFVFIKKIKCPWSEKDIKGVLREINKKVPLTGGMEINVIGSALMRSLNKHSRGIDKVTDVLSFAWQEDKLVPGNFLGQIYICYPRIVSQAKEYKVPANEEFIRILTHGILHILGYDHTGEKEAKKMFKLQEEIVGHYR